MDSITTPRFAVVIDDDADIRQLLVDVLTQAGFQAIPTGNGLDGVAAVKQYDPLITTLDVNMPGMDGFETAKRIRAFSPTYIVMLTALEDEIDTLQGLESGADDYIVKPFRPRVLRARIDAMLRRPRVAGGGAAIAGGETAPPAAAQPVASPMVVSQTPATQPAPAAQPPADEPGWIEHNGLWLNTETRVVRLHGAEVDLTRSEFDLLSAILQSNRRVRTKPDLALLLRGEGYVTSYLVSEADKRAIEVHMGNLRKKLSDSVTAPRWIETVRGVGYRLTAPLA
jgi:DNA-binding response OmpR family regulator